MKVNKKLIGILVGVIVIVLLVLPPIFDSRIHHDHSPKSAIRIYISEKGYAYQSFFAIIQSTDVYDEDYGNRYEVTWKDWKSETGMTPTICYTKKNEKDTYSVSCGTGP